MWARIGKFFKAAKNHPLWFLVAFIWSSTQWFLDHRYGERLYQWLTKERPEMLAGPSSWVAEHWFAINVSALVLWAAYLFYRMWKESRPIGTGPSDRTTTESRPAPLEAPPAQPNDPVGVPGFEFHPNRSALPSHRQPRPQLESAEDEVWALWNTGALVARGQMLRVPNRKRILLPHPELVAPFLADAEGASTATIAAQIEELTRVAWQTARDENLSIEVRWLTKVPRNTLLLGDPDAPRTRAWALIELFQPGVPEDMRPVLWFTAERFPRLYEWLCVTYTRLWDESVDPRWRPYIEVVAQQILFNLKVRQPIRIDAVSLTVTTPDGARVSVDQSRQTTLQGDEGLWFGYPQNFNGAGALRSGRYEAQWAVREGTRWRDAVTATYEVCLPQDSRLVTAGG